MKKRLFSIAVLAAGVTVAFGAATRSSATSVNGASTSEKKSSSASKVHVYYIAADEIQWNYAPHGRNLTGTPVSEMEGGPSLRTYRKAIYREYTDATFRALKPRPPQWEHLGILGPLIRAEVGDVVKIVFKNNTSIHCGMHPHGLAYDKASEGAAYGSRETSDAGKGDAVEPRKMYNYAWTVPERSGPGPMDGNSVVWMYHSHFVESRDMNTGLIGPIIVTARGASKADGAPRGIDREFVTLFSVFDESQSWYFEANRNDQERPREDLRLADPAVRQRYLVYSINGFVEGNLPVMSMRQSDKVRWYLLANSNEDDIHTPHWHGQTVLYNHMRTDTTNLEPMSMMTADMVPDKVGTWLFHCHVNEHFDHGMQALFTVTPRSRR